jgi:hypothetical protein
VGGAGGFKRGMKKGNGWEKRQVHRGFSKFFLNKKGVRYDVQTA